VPERNLTRISDFRLPIFDFRLNDKYKIRKKVEIMAGRDFSKRICFGLFQFALICAIFYPGNSARAAITLPIIFSDHMVLQRERAVPIWGRASPGDKITVEFAGQRKETTAGADGRWEIRLDPMPACKDGRDLQVSANGRDSIKLADVVVGEVWICSGQSNMFISLGGASDADKDISAANLPGLRLFQVLNLTSSSPRPDVAGKPWAVCSVQSAGGWTAVGFYFGRRLNSELDVPVGLISASWGSTGIEPWTPLEAFDTVPELAGYIGDFRKELHAHRQALPEAAKELEKWIGETRKAIAANRNLPVEPKWPVYPGNDIKKPAAIYNAEIFPLIPYAIRGAIWYQGENNSGNSGNIYYQKMRALIGGWRRAWAQGDFPFYYVQLASYAKPDLQPPQGAADLSQSLKWANARQCQLNALAITNTGMAVTIDISADGTENMHPRNKLDVGERLARWALARDYGKTNIVVSGPLYRNMKVEGNRIRLFFDHLGGGLMAGAKEGREPAREIKDGKLQCFAVAGVDKKWVWADAAIDGDTVLVFSPNVPQPVAVRYAYTQNPEGCNLYNRAGLPASPFRTDSW